MSDPATLRFYEAAAERYAQDGNDVEQRRFLDPWLDRLSPEAHILELGCGAGRHAARMAARGFTVDATDAAHEMVRLANLQCGVSARRMLFDELVAEATYDAVWANACLIHVPRTLFATTLTRIRHALRPGGWHFASFKLGDGEGRDALGRLHNFPDQDWLEASYKEADFLIHENTLFRGEGADGVIRDWLALTVQKPSR